MKLQIKKNTAVYKILALECQTCDTRAQSGTRNKFASHVCIIDVPPYTVCSYKNRLRMPAVPDRPHCSFCRKVTDFCYKSVTLTTLSLKGVRCSWNLLNILCPNTALLSKGGGKSSKCFQKSWLGRQFMLTRKLGVNTVYTWDPKPQANTQII
jgi:hypothetical protein